MTRRLLGSYLLLTVLVLGLLEIPLGITFSERQTDRLILDVERDAFAIVGLIEETVEHMDSQGTDPRSSDANGEGEEESGEPESGAAAEGSHDLDLDGLAEEYFVRTGGRIVIVRSDGLALADATSTSSEPRYFDARPEFAEALQGRVASGTRDSATLGGSIVYVTLPVASAGVVHGAVRITFSTSEIDKQIRAYWLQLGVIAIITLSISTAVGVLLARSVTAPLKTLGRGAEALGSGVLSERVPELAGPPEVRSVARTFNEMATRIEDLIAVQESFVADASHQLRTPLTALRLRLENIDADLRAAEVSQDDGTTKEVAAAISEVGRMSRLVDALLALARADRDTAAPTTGLVNIGALVKERVAAWEGVGVEYGVRIVWEGDPDPADLLVRLDPGRLDQVIDNLISNAVDAVEAQGGVGAEPTIFVRVVTEAEAVEIHVVDTGPGLSPEDRERAFDRFWRASGGSSPLGGSGLGLAIARRLVEIDHGTIRLEPVTPTGLNAIVRYDRETR